MLKTITLCTNHSVRTETSCTCNTDKDRFKSSAHFFFYHSHAHICKEIELWFPLQGPPALTSAFPLM